MSGKKGPTQKEINDRYWNFKKGQQLNEHYQSWLSAGSRTHSQESIEAYAAEMTGVGSHKHMDRTERQLFTDLGGKVPPTYD